jgi:hypothetical protein
MQNNEKKHGLQFEFFFPLLIFLAALLALHFKDDL